MRTSLLFAWAASIILGIAVVVWTGYWMYFFLFTEMKEAMVFGTIPTVVGTALVVWLLMFLTSSRKRNKRVHTLSTLPL